MIIKKGDLSVLLMYSPQRFDPRFGAVKPEGSLGLMYLASTLRNQGYEVKILDCSVGEKDSDDLEKTFFRQTKLSDGMIRIGLDVEDIVEKSRDYKIIGISSIFSAQTSMVIEVIRAIKIAYPEKLIFSGGVNARSQKRLFLDSGTDIIFLGEAEKTLIEVLDTLSHGGDIRNISGISFMLDGQLVTNPALYVENDLDKLPIPAWDMTPMNKYWKIARPHGGSFLEGGSVAYAPAMTSRGCPFKCDFCHIKKETEGTDSGNLRQLRVKTIERVIREIEILRNLGVQHIFLEDDSLLGRKERALQIFKEITKMRIKLSGVNGINISHLCTTRNGLKGRVDDETMETMAEAGFQKFMLPVESGSQRIIDKYATGKLNLEVHDIPGLIRKAKELGMMVGGNYTFGYPDETREEMMATYELAKYHMSCGLDHANFMLITPFPGTEFYDRSMREGILLPEISLEDYDWMRLVIKTLIPEKELMEMITTKWKEINKKERIDRVRSFAPRK